MRILVAEDDPSLAEGLMRSLRLSGYAVDCVRKNEEPMYGVSGALGLRCNQIIEAMYASASEGKVVRGSW